MSNNITEKKKLTTIPCCVGVVTVTTVVLQPCIRTYYRTCIGFATKDLTPTRRKAIANALKEEIREDVLKNRENYGIKSLADVKFHAAVKILECDEIVGII